MKALKVISLMNEDKNDKELLFKAIDNYDVLTPSSRKVLKALIDLSIDDTIIISIVKLSQISSISRPVVYHAIETLKTHQYIEQSKIARNSISYFQLKPNKFKEIIKYYETQQYVKNKYLQT